jgi:hypothetical protein
MPEQQISGEIGNNSFAKMVPKSGTIFEWFSIAGRYGI